MAALVRRLVLFAGLLAVPLRPAVCWMAPSEPPLVWSPLVGPIADKSDLVHHDQTWAFLRFGPLTGFTVYKAWYYDGVWHNPGELKGLLSWYGGRTNNQTLLLGALRPHVPFHVSLKPEERIHRITVQHDSIMRFLAVDTSRGSKYAWGFPGVPGAREEVLQAPPGWWLAAFYGLEGKPMKAYRKRYIGGLGAVWTK